MKEQLLDLAKKRRSIYALGRNISQTPDEIADLIKKISSGHLPHSTTKQPVPLSYSETITKSFGISLVND